MTVVKNHEEYRITGEVYFVERYADNPHFAWYWRYGVFTNYGKRYAIILKDGLRRKPNLKRLFGN
jgi:hypothetical protein